MRFWLLLLGAPALWAGPITDQASVKVERRAGQDWCVLLSRAYGETDLPLERLVAVIEDYPSYPALFPRIREASAVRSGEAVLLTEKVVIQAVGVTVTNVFTLRVVKAVSADGRETRISWTTEQTDGTIDSLSGSWTLKAQPGPRPRVLVTYESTSAVPMRVPGQDVFLGMFLGGETRGVVEAVFKKAGVR